MVFLPYITSMDIWGVIWKPGGGVIEINFSILVRSMGLSASKLKSKTCLLAETTVIGNSKKMKSMQGVHPVSLEKNTGFSGWMNSHRQKMFRYQVCFEGKDEERYAVYQ